MNSSIAKPQNPQLQTGHSLANGLRGYWGAIYGGPEGTLRDSSLLGNDLLWEQVAAGVFSDTVGAFGWSVTSDRSATRWQIVTPEPHILPTGGGGVGNFSLMYVARPIAESGPFAGLFAIGAGGDEMIFGWNEPSATINASLQTSSFESNVDANVLSTTEPNVVVWRHDQNGWEMWVDGVLTDSGVDGIPSITETRFAVMSDEADGEFVEGEFWAGAVWGRALVAAEIISLTIDPYEVVRPRVQTVGFVPAAAAGPAPFLPVSIRQRRINPLLVR